MLTIYKYTNDSSADCGLQWCSLALVAEVLHRLISDIANVAQQ